jgi:hypothetical protein
MVTVSLKLTDLAPRNFSKLYNYRRGSDARRPSYHSKISAAILKDCIRVLLDSFKSNAVNPSQIGFELTPQFPLRTVLSVFPGKSFLTKLEIRQHILLKNSLCIHHKPRFKIILNAIKVKQLCQFYEKHKVFGWRQCLKNSLT